MKVYPALRIEGGLFSADLPEQILHGDLPGQKPADFGLGSRDNLTAEVAAAFADAQEYWRLFQSHLQRLPEGDPATSLTRSAWVLQLLRLLGYDLQYNTSAVQVDGQTYHLSHRADEREDSPPVHVVGYRQELDRRGGQRLSPHALLQEFLNRSEHLWGLVTNGRELRLLRDSTYVRKQAYLAFDLQQIFEERRFDEFLLLYRLLHRTRLPQGTADAPQCLLEQYYQHSLQQGGRVRDRLRDGVEECLKILGNGFLQRTLLERMPSTAEELYGQLLRLVYRLLFLLVSEERGLMGGNEVYLKHYSVSRLRRLVDQPAAVTEHEDLWHGLRVLWTVLRQPQFAQMLGVPPLDGELFAPMTLDDARISNRDLLSAFSHLVYYREERSGVARRVNYAALDTEELGSVYESLLEFHPVLDATARRFDLIYGSERKSTGSYYTPPELVAELVKSALEPVIEERLRTARRAAESTLERALQTDVRSADFSPPERTEVRTTNEMEQAILSIKVVDPACGSGHFLLAAARRLGKALAQVRTGEEEPAPAHLRRALRDVVAHCIYGVDKNPLAVELCRVALWLESHAEGMPLTFLDHRIRCGDSLVGVLHLPRLHGGIPDDAYAPVTGDDQTVCSALKRRNRQARTGQLGLFAEGEEAPLHHLAAQARQLDAIPDDTPDGVQQKSQRFRQMHADPEWRRQKEACDLWTAAFFQRYQKGQGESDVGERFITTETVWRRLREQPVHPQALAEAQRVAQQIRPFHWQLEFPEVFEQGGFDVVLGNPPWERIKLQEQEFFATRDPQIARAPNADARKRMIKALETSNPALWEEYERALHAAECTSRFLRGSGEYPLTGRGDINTYSVFAERMRHLLHPRGRAGILVPTGIATDDTNKHFFADLVYNQRIFSLAGFENEAFIFPQVHHSFKFCAVTFGGSGAVCSKPDYTFFCRRVADVAQPARHFTLTREDIERINPNTRTLPLFRTREDADLTRAIYERVPVLVNERTGQNPWGVRFLTMFHMSNDSGLFRTRAQLEGEGYRQEGNLFVKGGSLYLPLYEAKMVWHYDHRFGSYEGRGNERGFVELPPTSVQQYENPCYVPLPFYWVPQHEVEARLNRWKHAWLIGFRDVTSAVVQRTAIFSLLPRVGVGHTAPLVLTDTVSVRHIGLLLAQMCSIVLDWVLRQKLGGTHLTFFIVNQLPVLPPSVYSSEHLRFVVPRVLELVYTAWDVKGFFDDVWREADEALRQAIRAQWEANRWATGGVDPTPPEWLALLGLSAEGLPPFRWDAGRRAVLRAELDALYARLYGLTRKQLRYILDPADLTEKELADILDPWEEVSDPLEGYEERAARSDFPGETFRVLKEKELREYGEYRTRRLVLEAWERIESSGVSCTGGTTGALF